MLTVFSLVISGIALLISIITFFTNKAKHNLQQLQTRYQIFCDKFKTLLMFGVNQQLLNFKYDLENIVMYEPTELQCNIEFNNLQKENSKNIASCKTAYLELNENLDFFEIKRALRVPNKKDEFIKWFNETINQYYFKLNSHYVALYDINLIARMAQQGILMPNAFETINNFYKNIRDIIDMTEVLLILKREMTGAFGKLSVRSINFFQSNSTAIRKITKFINSFIANFGIDDVIYKKDYKKISVVYKEFSDKAYLKYLIEEEDDFCLFIDTLAKNNSHLNDD